MHPWRGATQESCRCRLWPPQSLSTIPQKINLSATCTRRGARKLLIWPKFVAVLLRLAKLLGLTQFSVLKLSPRTCIDIFSVILTFLIREASTLKKPGPRITPRPEIARTDGSLWDRGKAGRVEPPEALRGALRGAAV